MKGEEVGEGEDKRESEEKNSWGEYVRRKNPECSPHLTGSRPNSG